MVHMRGQVRLEEQEKVRADLDCSSSSFSIVHCFRGVDAAAAISGRPVRLIQNQHRPDFPPDSARIDAGIVYNVAMVRCWNENRLGDRTLDLVQCEQRF